MTEKAHEVKAPDHELVARAEAKIEAGDDPNQKEAKALAAQAQIDRERGYTTVDWHGTTLYQSLLTGHTTGSEYDMVQYHAELDGHGIVVPRG